jgi:hypothetical protein
LHRWKCSTAFPTLRPGGWRLPAHATC